MRHFRLSRAFLATCLLAVSNVVVADPAHLREAIGTALVGVAAAVSGGARKKEDR